MRVMNWDHKANRYRIVPILQLIGAIALIPFFGITFIAFIFASSAAELRSDPLTAAIGLIMFGVPLALGIWLLVAAIRNWRFLSAYDRYAPILNDLPDGSLATLAKVSQDPEDLVRKNIEGMLKRGFFPNGYFDPHKKHLILPGQTQKPDVTKEPIAKTVMLNCPHCGGRNLVTPGTRIICEFCDSEIY